MRQLETWLLPLGALLIIVFAGHLVPGPVPLERVAGTRQDAEPGRVADDQADPGSIGPAGVERPDPPAVPETLLASRL